VSLARHIFCFTFGFTVTWYALHGSQWAVFVALWAISLTKAWDPESIDSPERYWPYERGSGADRGVIPAPHQSERSDAPDPLSARPRLASPVRT
jgi:hypothetical protein